MISTTQASQDKQLSNTEQHLEGPTQKLEVDYNSPAMSREDYEQMSHEDLVSLAICQDLSSRLEINSLKLMLEQETAKKESLASLLDQEQSSRALLEERIKQATEEVINMEAERATLRAELALMRNLEREKKLRKERRKTQARKLEREPESLDGALVEQSETSIVEVSGSQSTNQMSLQVSRPDRELRKEERRAQLARREGAKAFERFRLQFEEFLREKLPHLLDRFHEMVPPEL
ncbi:hypothetical protein KCU65_g1362, partial [Aureobasidium melanogenum]